jgi:hypothetical protein
MPHFGVDINETKPLLNVCRNFLCKAASVQEVGVGFLRLITKFTIATILPTLAVKSTSRPHSILKHLPSEILHLGVAHGFQTVEGMVGVDESFKLHLISRG